MGFAKYIREHEYTNSVELDAYYIQERYILGYPLINAWCLLLITQNQEHTLMIIPTEVHVGLPSKWTKINMKCSYDMPFLRAEADLKMLHWRFDQKQICLLPQCSELHPNSLEAKGAHMIPQKFGYH